MKNLKPLAQILLCTLFPLSGAVFAQDPMSMPMSGHDMSTSAPDTGHKKPNKKQDADAMKNMPGMADMPGMDKTASKQPPATPPAPPVGSLPSSDGTTGKSYQDVGIDMHSMNMEDDPLIAKLMLDKLEYVHGKHDSMVWDGRFRFGHDLNQLWIRSEGQQAKGKIQDAEAELLWGHTFSPFWTVMTGVRHDFGTGPSRDWAALGIQGLAPYKFDVEATAYLGAAGRTALKLKTSYDLLLTQRLILTPELDANLYSKDDRERGVGAGLSDTSLGVRLRYEIRREFAPYIGFNLVRKYGKTADFSRAEGTPAHDFQLVTGVRIWF